MADEPRSLTGATLASDKRRQVLAAFFFFGRIVAKPCLLPSRDSG